MKWILKDNPYEKLAPLCGGNPILAAALSGRGITEEKKIKEFITPSSKNFGDVTLIRDMPKGFELLSYALKNNIKIGICGDYDADGVMSTVILYKAIEYLGGNVCYRIPHRVKDGYGINNNIIDSFNKEGCGLVITCDNGIAAVDQMSYARTLGIKTIVLDHHEPAYVNEGQILPDADAVIDAKCSDSLYGFREMCAAGLCYRFVKEFFKYMDTLFALDRELVTLASVATVCDIVPLKEDNRLIVLLGLELINKDCRNLGLRTLKDIVLKDKKATEHSFGFVIGPCVNAAGRIGDAEMAVELFTTQNESRACELAKKLALLNEERKELTEQCFDIAMNSIEKNKMENDKIIVTYCKDINESVAGITAGKIKEKLYRPVIVLTESEGIVKGSARSIEGYDIFKELNGCRELMTKFGGHSMAAGLSLEEKNVSLLRETLNKNCTLTPDDLEEKVYVDMILDLSQLSVGAAEELDILRPFGAGNPEMFLACYDITVTRARLVGKNMDIVQLSICDKNGINIDAIWFYGAEQLFTMTDKKNTQELKLCNRLYAPFKADIVFSLMVDEYKGNKKVKLNIKDMKIQ